MPDGREWLDRLPGIVSEVKNRWSLSLSSPFDGDGVSCAWVAPGIRGDGSRAVLKVGMPHMEAAHELHGLRFWDGGAIVRVLDADESLNAMLLERCEPGTSLRAFPEIEQDVIVARILLRLWRKPPAACPFRPLSSMLEHWAAETMASECHWRDAGLVNEGLRLFKDLSRPAADDVLLATDLHAGNVLVSQREPWLAIDPKPFVGDRAYDATQHLLNCKHRLSVSTDRTIGRFADLLEVDVERIRRWMFARVAADPRDAWEDESIRLAKVLAG
jgi:streptomycin 6-kinase